MASGGSRCPVLGIIKAIRWSYFLLGLIELALQCMVVVLNVFLGLLDVPLGMCGGPLGVADANDMVGNRAVESRQEDEKSSLQAE